MVTPDTDDDHTAQQSDSACYSPVRYAREGFRMLPLWGVRGDACCCRLRSDCRSPGKHPLGVAVHRGAIDASADPRVVAVWAQRFPSANWGIATGAGLLVLDVDPRNGGVATMEQLEWRLGVLPHTVEAATGGQGAHLYFRAGPGTRARGQLGPGVDVKFDGGYVVAPPSIHVSGRTYSWPKGRSPSRGLIARLPTAWIRVLTRGESARPPFAVGTTIESSEREQRARSYVRRIPPAVSGRGGHTATFRAALLVVRGFDLDVETALRVLREEWNPACEPPWSEHDLHRKVREAARSRAPRGFLLVDRRGSR